MSLLQVFSAWRGAPRLDELSREIARRLYATIRVGVEDRLRSLSPAEARGYVRAKAFVPVAREVARTLEREPKLGSRASSALAAITLDRLVAGILVDVLRPSAQRNVRRAA